ATPQVRMDIQANLGLKDPCVIIHGFDRPNLTFGVVSASTDREKDWQLLKLFGKAPSGKQDNGSGNLPSGKRFEDLPTEVSEKLGFLESTLRGSGLVYVATTSEAKRVSELLNEAG